MIKAIIFDLDQTLLNRQASLESFIDAQYDRYIDYLTPVSQAEFKSKFMDFDNNGYVWKDKVYASLIEYFNIRGLTKDELLEDYITTFCDYCIPFPYLYETLDELTANNYKLGIITNGKFPFQLYNINALKLDTYMDTILISEQENIKKPDPLIFEKAAKQLGFAMHECLFVGDNFENDYQAAKNAGMYAIYKANHQAIPTSNIPFINNLGELISQLKNV
ncbi:HAD family hydrolase [Helicobacter pylori]